MAQSERKARNALTERYLTDVAGTGPSWDEVVAVARREVDLDSTIYFGRLLSRPVFLDHTEQSRLAQDVAHLHTALTSLPDLLFGGDVERYARAVGLADQQVGAIMRSPRGAPTALARADLYHDGSGFRLLETNVGSPVGGADNALANRAILAHPAVAEFVADHRLAYIDTMRAVADTLRAECRLPDGARPLVVATDTPANFGYWGKLLHYSATLLSAHGLEVVARPLDALTRRGGRVLLDDDRAVDAIYRVFTIEDMLAPEGQPFIDPVLDAVAAGEVAMFTPMDADLYGAKGALALLTDEAHRPRLAPELLASVDRLVPWTRMARDEPVTVDGERVDLREYARERREELVLKPSAGLGGQDVVLGWLVDDAEWRRRLDAAMADGYVLQHRIRPVPEPFPAADGTRSWVLNWGAFHTVDGYGGTWVRAGADAAGEVINMATGASATCCFHATA